MGFEIINPEFFWDCGENQQNLFPLQQVFHFDNTPLYNILSFCINLIFRLRKDLEEAAIQQEATILSLKKKHQDAIAEMSEQIDHLNKLKTKAETEKG